MDEETIFLEAAGLDSPEGRAEFLDRACGDDAELRDAVESLLRSHDSAGDFLEKPYLVDASALDEPPKPQSLLDFLADSDVPGSLGRLGSYEILEVLGAGGDGRRAQGARHEAGPHRRPQGAGSRGRR